MARAIEYAGLIDRHVTMYIHGAAEASGEGVVAWVMDWDDGSAVTIMFEGGKWVDITTRDADRWRITIRTGGGSDD